MLQLQDCHNYSHKEALKSYITETMATIMIKNNNRHHHMHAFFVVVFFCYLSPIVSFTFTVVSIPCQR